MDRRRGCKGGNYSGSHTIQCAKSSSIAIPEKRRIIASSYTSLDYLFHS